MNTYEIPFITLCIREFAKKFSLTRKEAYDYLHKYDGITFLLSYYDVEHIQSIDDTIDDLIICCKNKGGLLS